MDWNTSTDGTALLLVSPALLMQCPSCFLHPLTCNNIALPNPSLTLCSIGNASKTRCVIGAYCRSAAGRAGLSH